MTRLSSLLALLSVAALGLAGCPDTKGRLDRFVVDSEPLRLTPSGVPCDGPTDATGEYFIAASVALAPDKPILFRGDLSVDLTAKTVQLDMVALTVSGRVEIGDVITAVGELADDGTFVLEFGETTIPADADAVLPQVEVKADMTFTGCTSSAVTVCGLVDGLVTEPAELPLVGSTWGGLALEAGDDITVAPVLASCTAVAAQPR
ncbi:MAG: hypothetical protein EP329_03600 [Deltaproteobacteria bacterium]|nr:MAG: hypothetical protein EP329_03600 [Deltaproteobacteria bacterium]